MRRGERSPVPKIPSASAGIGEVGTRGNGFDSSSCGYCDGAGVISWKEGRLSIAGYR